MLTYVDVRCGSMLRVNPQVLSAGAPEYLGIHVSNLVRDGILASFQPLRELNSGVTNWEDADFASPGYKGRREHMYYAIQGAGDRLDYREVRPYADVC